MIQVIHRALDILELLDKEPEIPKTLAEISGSLNLNPGTCANIIKTLITRNYIEKLDKQKTYTLGPLSYKLGGDESYKKHLIDAAKEELEKLTRKINETTLVSILSADMRISVVIAEGANDLAVQSNLIKKAYGTATGRLLISYLSDPELEKFVDKYGLPEPTHWKEIKSRKRLNEELQTIRANNYSLHITDSQIIGLAVPVYMDINVIASLGVYMPLFRFTNWKEGEILKMLHNTSKKISLKLI